MLHLRSVQVQQAAARAAKSWHREQVPQNGAAHLYAFWRAQAETHLAAVERAA